MNVTEKTKRAKKASRILASLDSGQRAEVLFCMARELELGQVDILEANAKDLKRADNLGITGAMRKRLALSESKVQSMADALKQIARLPDSLGETIETINRPNGLIIKKIRVPFGVIGIIYESRPNVTADAAALCIKSGNAVILRGGKEAFQSNSIIVQKLRAGMEKAGVTPECIQFVDNLDHAEARTMMSLRGQIDLLIPRGGPKLIQSTIENAKVPVIETGVGNCHTYVDVDADLEIAHAVAVNAKINNPAVCNAMETLLVHRDIAHQFLPKVSRELIESGVELRGCPECRKIVPEMKPATHEDWSAEYLDLILALKIVSGLEEAIEHITNYGTTHSEAIITENQEKALIFTQSIDAATVYVNASTRFTDGGEFGFGAEMGISTQKLHARGPMGIKELTTHKYVVEGTGQIR